MTKGKHGSFNVQRGREGGGGDGVEEEVGEGKDGYSKGWRDRGRKGKGKVAGWVKGGGEDGRWSEGRDGDMEGGVEEGRER